MGREISGNLRSPKKKQHAAWTCRWEWLLDRLPPLVSVSGLSACLEAGHFSDRAVGNISQPPLLKIHIAISQSCSMGWATAAAASSTQAPATPAPRDPRAFASLLRDLAICAYMHNILDCFKGKKYRQRVLFRMWVRVSVITERGKLREDDRLRKPKQINNTENMRIG